MRLFFALLLYRLLLPLLFLAAFPGWLVKMLRRGGFGTRLGERSAVYTTPLEYEPCGAVHIHSVSVGETLLALKLVREWRLAHPGQAFVIATGTATGHAVATAAGIEHLRVTYAPLDFPSIVRRYLNRFEPSRIVLIEGDVWPHLLLGARHRRIPVGLVNARVSPRSARRYRKAAAWVRPVFSMLDQVAVQESEDAALWETLGVDPSHIHPTGSLKFDPGSGPLPAQRPEFQALLDAFGASRPVVLAASTHSGEEPWIAAAIREADPRALPVIVPRHAERREDVALALRREGFEPVLRSAFHPPSHSAQACLIVDSTGELRDWTAHADAVVIGKSFFATGGQNPTEAILARKPLICGPHMENFEPLASLVTAAGGCLRPAGFPDLVRAVRQALDPAAAGMLSQRAAGFLDAHAGATRRTVGLLTRSRP